MPSTALQARLARGDRSAWPVAAEARDWAVGSELVVSGGVVIGAALLALVPVVVVVAAFFLDAGIVIRGLTHGCVMLIEWLNAGRVVVGRAGALEPSCSGAPWPARSGPLSCWAAC